MFASVIFLLSAFAVSAQVNLPIGNLAPGETITITYDVTLTNPFPSSVFAVTNQGTVSGSNFATLNTDDPQTGAGGDATVTIVEVPPAVTTLAATSVTLTSATLNASINPNNFATIAYFQFGPTVSYGTVSATNNLAATNLLLASSAVISNLSPGTLYHFRAVATNNAGITLGNDLTFTTVALPPPLLKNPTVLTNGAFRLSFTNTAGQTFTVLAATDVGLPSSNWTVLGPVTEGPAGQFQFTDSQATNFPLRFYRVRWP